jgi:hypothetical protein
MSYTSAPRLFLTLSIAIALGGCASGITRMDGAPGRPTTTDVSAVTSVKAVNLWLSADAKKLVADNLKFNQDQLRSTIERALSAQNLLKADSANSLDIEITNIRTRSNFSAVVFGFMAGNDLVEGIVTIKNDSGKVLKRGKVSSSYALGGLAGGQDDTRMSWLYESFSKHAVEEVAGGTVNNATVTPTATASAISMTADTDFAKIDDVQAVPLLLPKGREGYVNWLSKPLPRAFVIGPDGSATWTAGAYQPKSADDPADATERALARCEKRVGKPCKVYAIDRRVVWVP